MSTRRITSAELSQLGALVGRRVRVWHKGKPIAEGVVYEANDHAMSHVLVGEKGHVQAIINVKRLREKGAVEVLPDAPAPLPDEWLSTRYERRAPGGWAVVWRSLGSKDWCFRVATVIGIVHEGSGSENDCRTMAERHLRNIAAHTLKMASDSLYGGSMAGALSASLLHPTTGASESKLCGVRLDDGQTCGRIKDHDGNRHWAGVEHSPGCFGCPQCKFSSTP